MTSGRRRELYWSGLALYLVSFFLVATYNHEFKGTMRGYQCAWIAPVVALGEIGSRLHHEESFAGISLIQLISLFASGLINPAFGLFALTSPFRPRDYTVRFLRVFIPALIPFCWIFFLSFGEWWPREGHFVWVMGMLFVLCASIQSKEAEP